MNRSSDKLLLFFKGGGVHPYQLGKHDFELGVEGGGQDMSRHFGVGFGSMRTILPMLDFGAKNGSKNQNLN